VNAQEPRFDGHGVREFLEPCYAFVTELTLRPCPDRVELPKSVRPALRDDDWCQHRLILVSLGRLYIVLIKKRDNLVRFGTEHSDITCADNAIDTFPPQVRIDDPQRQERAMDVRDDTDSVFGRDHARSLQAGQRRHNPRFTPVPRTMVSRAQEAKSNQDAQNGIHGDPSYRSESGDIENAGYGAPFIHCSGHRDYGHQAEHHQGSRYNPCYP
jgi:hypothetical protein